MSDDLFVKTYRVVFKESDNAFHVKYHVEPRQNEKPEVSQNTKPIAKVQKGENTTKPVKQQAKTPEKKVEVKVEAQK